MSNKKTTVAKRASTPKKAKTPAKVVPIKKVAVASKPNSARSVKSVPVKAAVAKSFAKNGASQAVISGVKPPANGVSLAQSVVVSKTEVFTSGDKVVYPAHGVGAIDSIQSRTIGGSEAKFYMITIIETGMKVMVPVSQAATVGLRKIVDAKTVEKVYDILRDKDVIVQQQTWNRRFREYTQKLKTGSVFEIAKVIRDLSVLKGDKELSFGERKMLDTAQGLLVKELSIAKSRSEEIIREELQTICDA
jgi:CarD family transcriptional regulator